jgi:branched-chain amino acid transport system substrate-binding protein
VNAYSKRYGDKNPDPYAIYGYEAMKLGLDTIKGLGDKGSDKQAVLAALFATKNRSSVLGTYSFDKNGDTSLTDYGIYKVGTDGNPTFDHAIKAAT